MRPIILTLALLASALTLPLTAQADAIDQFTFSFDTTPEYQPFHLAIDLPASPPVLPYSSLICGDCFVVLSEPVGYIFQFSNFQNSNGSTGTDVGFAQNSLQNLLPVARAYRFVFTSEDLFTGSLSDPTFIPGTFDAMYRPFSTAPNFPGTITIEPINTTVPEPSTLAMMATGILGAITTLRSRKPRVSSEQPGQATGGPHLASHN